jgi:hypothetical protein
MVSSYQKYLVNYILNLTSHNAERQGKDESIKHGRDWLEDGNVLDKGSIPCISKHEGRDENVENKEEELGEHIRLSFRLGDTVKDLHFTR